MKVPSIEEVTKAGEQLCLDGKMDKQTQDYYNEHGNHDVILSAADMLWLDELEDMEVENFFVETVNQITLH